MKQELSSMKHAFIRRWLWLFLAGFLVLAGFWPRVASAQGETMAQVEGEIAEGRIVEIVNETADAYSETQETVTQEVVIELTTSDRAGEKIPVIVSRLLQATAPRYQVGDRVMVHVGETIEGEALYYIVDYVRRDSLYRLVIIFCVVVLAVAGWHGVRSILSLILSFGVIFWVILPQIQAGYEPVLVALFGSVLLAMVTFYLSHGFRRTTTVAIAGTAMALALTVILANLFTGAAKLTGFSSEEVVFLQAIKGEQLNVQGLLLAGMILGALGVLDDITISQVSVVSELKRADRKLKPAELYSKAMNVGKDHIASLVNTLVLVYAGAALPLLLLFQLDVNRSFAEVINYEIIAEEVVRTLVGSIGLVLAVPITTFLASYFGAEYVAKEKTGHIHSH